MSTHGSIFPVHSQNDPIMVRRIEHKNPYDFTKEHRHTYFEVFFFETGGGKQLIDFVDLPVKPQSCYIVYPQQIHLLRRAPAAKGRLIQFGEEVISSPSLLALLQQNFHGSSPAIIFEKNKSEFKKMGGMLDLLQEALLIANHTSSETSLHLLHALLLTCFASINSPGEIHVKREDDLLLRFRTELEIHYRSSHKVSFYASGLGVSEKKLATLTGKLLNMTPLQVIHNRVLLEAKRLLLTGTVSHKEISFDLGFDSPSSFSLFIKSKTGFSPSELLKELEKIHK
jgi:AraC-like DNA-binding protein